MWVVKNVSNGAFVRQRNLRAGARSLPASRLQKTRQWLAVERKCWKRIGGPLTWQFLTVTAHMTPVGRLWSLVALEFHPQGFEFYCYWLGRSFCCRDKTPKKIKEEGFILPHHFSDVCPDLLSCTLLGPGVRQFIFGRRAWQRKASHAKATRK